MTDAKKTPGKPGPKPRQPRERPQPALVEARRLAQAATELDWKREALKQAEEMYAEARRMRSFVAAEKCLRTAAALRNEIAALEKALGEREPASESEFLAELGERLKDLPLPYLELAVEEYLRRLPGVRLVGATG